MNQFSSLWLFYTKYRMEIISAGGMFFFSCILIHFTALRYGTDDQFILYRYVDNIVAGYGFVYNIGERVLGSTTPLFTLICSLFKYFLPWIATPDIVAALNIIFLSIASAFFYRVSRAFLSEKFSLAAVSIFIFSLAKTIPEGMETPLFILLFFVFLDCLLREKHYASSIFLALTILTRPDAGLVAVLVVAYWWYRLGLAKTVRLSAVAVIIALPWLIFSTLYFGSFVPQSLLTKLHTDSMLRIAKTQAVKVQLASMSRTYWGKFIDPNDLAFQITFNLIPFLFFIYVAIKKRMNAKNWIVFAIPFLYFVSFSISNPVMYPWYISQMEPLWILISFIGIAYLIKKIKSYKWKGTLLVLIVAGPALFYAQVTASNDIGSKAPLFDMGQYIKEHERSGDTVGAANIGIVGYITNLYLIDFYGLIRDDSIRYYPITDACLDKTKLFVVPPDLVKDTQPTWIVGGTGEMESCFLSSDWFTSHYTVAFQVGQGNVWHLKK